MKKTTLWILSWGILFLFLLQAAGTLVESIYILDLLNTTLDEKALGLLFFFAPVLLWLIRKKTPAWVIWILYGLLLVSRSVLPFLSTLGRLVAAGVSTSALLLLLAWMLSGESGDEQGKAKGNTVAAGLALATALSVFLRTANGSVDYSLTMTGAWVGWLLGLLFGYMLMQILGDPAHGKGTEVLRLPTRSVVGVILAWTMVYFAFSAPAVIARWTEGSYFWIVTVVSLLALLSVWISLASPGFLGRISPTLLLGLNLLFTLALTSAILAHRIPFPATPSAAPFVEVEPTLNQYLPLAAMLLLFPVIFLDVWFFVDVPRSAGKKTADMAPGILLGAFLLVLLIFMHIFTNVWGYVEPVSPFFRNKFGLPFTLLGGLLALLVAWLGGTHVQSPAQPAKRVPWSWVAALGLIFLGSAFFAWDSERVTAAPGSPDSLVAMTYNIQQANDGDAEKSYLRQLALIQEVNPDILALQESDSARVSLNNNDYVRYFASKLGYYSYYGPRTTTGTYGTAILSRYPLENPRSVFSYSDQDEIGTSEAEIVVGGQRITIYNVHPDGSDTAMEVFAETLVSRSGEKENVIALGDYNLRADDAAFQIVAALHKNAWTTLYPDAISDSGLDMSGRNRIDHIFVSSDLQVLSAEYLLPPASQTDHPVHWAVIGLNP